VPPLGPSSPTSYRATGASVVVVVDVVVVVVVVVVVTDGTDVVADGTSVVVVVVGTSVVVVVVVVVVGVGSSPYARTIAKVLSVSLHGFPKVESSNVKFPSLFPMNSSATI
jgi:hypothetical protein